VSTEEQAWEALRGLRDAVRRDLENLVLEKAGDILPVPSIRRCLKALILLHDKRGWIEILAALSPEGRMKRWLRTSRATYYEFKFTYTDSAGADWVIARLVVVDAGACYYDLSLNIEPIISDILEDLREALREGSIEEPAMPVDADPF